MVKISVMSRWRVKQDIRFEINNHLQTHIRTDERNSITFTRWSRKILLSGDKMRPIIRDLRPHITPILPDHRVQIR